MKFKILIIGNRGFIGSYLFSYFSQKHEVWGCDSINRGDKSNILTHNNPTFKDIFETNDYDYCINCAGSASVPDSFNNPLRDFNSNVGLVQNIITNIYTYNRNCRFLNISSAAVYGNPVHLPIPVDLNLAPISPYGIHKELAEILLKRYYQLHGVQSCSLRIFSAYGNGQRKLLLWDLFNRLYTSPENSSIELFGTGYETRDYIHITDIARQIELVINNALFQGEPYNIANGEEVSIHDVAEIMKNEIHPTQTIKFSGTNRIGDPVNWQADISNLIKWGYVKNVPIVQGIKEYCEWAKKIYND